MEKIKGFKHVVIGGEMSVTDFAKSILKLVNYRSSIKDSIIDVKTVEGTNNVVVSSCNDIAGDLKGMFNAENVITYPLTVYCTDWSDLGKKIANEIENLVYEKEEEVLITSTDFTS